jgi:NAD(P)-dependent dehydrogenase (short-subunit alcohol dehydrogenase family)
VITGGASGIGLAAAQALAAVGRPVALWDINAAAAADAAEAIKKAYDVPVVAVTVDLRNPQAILPAVIEARRALRRIGGLVHAAGAVDSTGIEGVTPDTGTRALPSMCARSS